MKKEKETGTEYNKIDWMITLLPLGTIIILCVLFFFMPEQSNAVVSQIRYVLGDTFGTHWSGSFSDFSLCGRIKIRQDRAGRAG